MCFKKICLTFLIPVTLFTGCKNDLKDDVSTAFIGGQIINPTSNHLIILKNNIPLDTVYLNQKNRFSYRIEDVESGVYLIKHTSESQIVHIEPGDSILLRANSSAFDESLHFSGIGGEKNNLLTEMSLMDAENTKLILSYYHVEPEAFARKTDSIRKNRRDLLKRRNQRYKFSTNFLDLAKNSIDYEHYDLRERYAYMVNKYYKEFVRKVSQDFHAYRENINYNNEDLQTSPSYIRFIESRLINGAITECAGANVDDKNCYDLYDHRNITMRINLIDSLTDLPLIKDHFFSKFGAMGIIMANNREEILDILELLQEKGYNQSELEELKNMGSIQLAYLPGMNIGEVPLIDFTGKNIFYKELTDRPTVVFLWSLYSPNNHRRNHKVITELKKKYPEINFVGVNVDVGETTRWINAIHKYNYDPDTEFQLAQTEIKKELFQYYLNKSLLVDASGKVVIGDAYVNTPEFESRVLELLNQ